jgi:hypothetical protein
VREGTHLAMLPAAAEQPQAPALKSWAIVEIYGHQRIVGNVTVDPVEFSGMVRIDVPDLLKDGEVVRAGFTRYLGKGAVYSLTPVDEAIVRKLLPHVDGLPSRPASIGAWNNREDF